MISMKTMEYQFWEPYSQIENSENDPNQSNLPKKRSHKFSRLSSEDMHLYGLKPETDVFSVVDCQYCGMVLKTQALYNHILKRHHIGSISEDPQLPVEQPTKIRKIADDNIKFDGKLLEPIRLCGEDFACFKKPFTPPPKGLKMRRVTCSEQSQSGGKIMRILHRSVSMDESNQMKPQQGKLLVKFKRSGEGSWMVISP